MERRLVFTMTNSKVAILTNFMEFNPAYSLTGIVQDQCKMLQDNNHPVKLFVNSQYKLSQKDEVQFSHNVSSKLPSVDLYRNIPFSHLVDYTSINSLSDHHKDIADQVEEMLIRELQDVEIVFTHDFVFTGWFLPYGLGVMKAAARLPNTKFFHWIHSTPSTLRDWWDFNSWKGHHKLIFPNRTEKVRIAEQYRTLPQNVSCIHHIKDLRTWNDFCTDSDDFIHDYPQMLRSDIIQVYPVSSDRFEAKRLDIVFEIFSNLKNIGYSIFLVVANQWATGKERERDVLNSIEMAKRFGLEYGQDFVFTSLWKEGKYNTGIHKRMLRDLMSCSNVFVFPTREESFGLVGVEIPLSTAAIMVTNRSLAMMKEIHGGLTEDFDFGSFNQNVNFTNPGKYYNDIALLIHGSLRLNDVVLHRTMMRQRYNWDYLYIFEYLPLMDSIL